jgi:tRNA nucleotidyltransferase/poly(A) polymerase
MTTKKPNGSTKIYLDMDGVLADFFGEWATLAGVTTGNWKDIPPAKIDPTLDKMIGTDFFNRLPKFPTTNALVSMVLKYTGEYHINSSPLRGDHENSGSWKKVWIKRELNPQPVSIVITGRKESYAVNRDGSPNILIDDRGANIDAWTIKGGIGIKYQADENTIAEVRARLDKFFNVMPEVPVVTDTTDDITEGAEQKMSSEQMLAKLSKEMQGTHTGAPDPSSDWSKYVLSHKGFTLKDIQVDKIPTAVKSDGMSQANIEKYKKADTTKFPPVVIGDNGYLLDGNHRLQAYKYQGIKTIKAYIGESTNVLESKLIKHPTEIGTYLFNYKGNEYKISKHLNNNERHTGEWSAFVKTKSTYNDIEDWDWIDTVYSRAYIIQRIKDTAEFPAEALVSKDPKLPNLKEPNKKSKYAKRKAGLTPIKVNEDPERVEFDVSGNKDKGYVLNKILVPKDLRDTGIGTKAMKDFIAKADAEDAIIALTPSNAFGGAKLRLIHFYKRFGFVLNKGRNKDFRYRETMIRYPTNYKVEGRQITELFNSAYNWNWQTNDTDFALATFDTDDSNTVLVQFKSKSPGSPNFEVGFQKGDSVTRSGEGDEFKIFATVIDTIQEFMLSRPTVESISFVAKREGKALDGPHIRDSRAELYKRMVTKFANKHNMEFTWQVIARMTEFILRRKVTGVNEADTLNLPSIIDNTIVTLGKLFAKNNYEIRIVGGAVRDVALDRTPKDIDLATDATPTEMQAMFDSAGIRHIPTGIEHGTITAVIDNEPYEITTLRADKNTDGRHAEVAFVRSWEEDAKRRDLTYNAMSLDMEGNVHDYFGGMDDLQNKVSKFVGDPEERIKEDYLRILRYFRFQSKLDTPTFDKEIIDVISKNAKGLTQISAERIWQEMSKLLVSPGMADAVSWIDKAGVAKYIGLDITGTPKQFDNPIIALANIISDDSLGSKWKLSNSDKELLTFLIKNKLTKINQTRAEDLVAGGFSDSYVQALATLQNVKLQYVNVPEFPVTGKDLIALGIKSGPNLGILLAKLKQIWQQSRFKASKEDLLKNLADVVEGKSPHKKGTPKYKKHMAAMHAGMNEELDYTQPDFDAEWEEAERYPKFKEMGKEEWIKLASKGKSINIDNILSNLIGNTEAGEKFRHTWNNLEPAKKKRFLQALKKEKIELPLIARFPDNKLELIGGNTRLTGLMLNKGEARAWIFNA